MLAEHLTPWPLRRMGNLVLELTYYLQAKGLYISNRKEVVMSRIRTCHLWMFLVQSQVCYHEATEPFTSFDLLSFSDAQITALT